MKTVTRKKTKTKAKSRAIARPAFQHRYIVILKHACSFVAPALYVLAVLVLMQFASVQVALGFYERPTVQDLIRSSFAKPQIKAPTPVGLPMRLKIPSAQVDATIHSVGVTTNGAMGSPSHPHDTAWYKFGPKPGEKGNAVIAGHVDWWYGATGVFKNLKTLKPGDLITVQDDHGVSMTFIVRAIQEFGPKDDTSSVFVSNDKKSHLNLVTCSGFWDKRAQTYSKRLVVFTDKL